jgi:hypothetical protein
MGDGPGPVIDYARTAPGRGGAGRAALPLAVGAAVTATCAWGVVWSVPKGFPLAPVLLLVYLAPPLGFGALVGLVRGLRSRRRGPRAVVVLTLLALAATAWACATTLALDALHGP